MQILHKLLKPLSELAEMLNVPIYIMPQINNFNTDNVIIDLNEDGDIIYLRICNIRLSEFPAPILDFTNLQVLEIINAGLTYLPETISVLQNLQRLKISGNEITEIPNSIASIETLKSISYKANPITYPPPEILAQGIKGIKYFLSSGSGQFKSLNELKVVLIGDGGSGKTSVLKRLINDSFNDNESKTHGIRIEDKIIYIEDDKYKVNFWDFGGQEIMHSTHQFFLSKRSLYILVLDGRKEEDPEYWLNHIKMFGENSPVIVVLNKYDDNMSFDVNRKFLREKFPNIREFVKISCKTRFNLISLREIINLVILDLDHISTKWPIEWFRIKEHLETVDKDYISYEAYESICSSYTLEDRIERQSLIDFLNDLGVVLHFDDINLNETNVINPRWITDAVYSIINSETASENKGLVSVDSLSSVLEHSLYPRAKYGYILGMMKKFELCYAVNDSSILIPDLLDIQEPEIDFNYKKSLSFLYKYNFLPKSILAKFIVKSNQENQTNINWRTGIYLVENSLSTNAIVKVDYQDRTISINVSGDNRIEFFSIIRSRFNTINDSFQSLEFSELIPCICRECTSDVEPFYFKYHTLLKCVKYRKAFLTCEKSILDVNVVELLKGIEMGIEEFQWDVFISYSSNDYDTIVDLCSLLKGNKVTYWLDRDQIKVGDVISRKIENGLNNSSNILLCISKNQLRSGWSRAEYASLLGDVLNERSNKRIIPLIIDDIEHNDIPPLLKDLNYVKFSDKSRMRELMDSCK